MLMPRSRTLTVLTVALVLIGGANVAAYATNGHPLLLGRSNSETRTAKVTIGAAGPALSLVSRPSSPSLAVSSSKLVRHLNAAKLDGRTAASLQTQVTDFVIPGDNTTAIYKLAGVRPGKYVVNIDVGVTVTGASNPFCWLYNPNTSSLLSAWQNENDGGISIISGSSTITWNGGLNPMQVMCFGGAIYQSSAGSLPNTISFTRISKLVTGTPSAKAGTPKAGSSTGR